MYQNNFEKLSEVQKEKECEIGSVLFCFWFSFTIKMFLNVTWQIATEDAEKSFGTDILSGIVINSEGPL